MPVIGLLVAVSMRRFDISRTGGIAYGLKPYLAGSGSHEEKARGGVKEIHCGCYYTHFRDEVILEREECAFTEAMDLIIKLMNRVKYWEAGLGGDELHSEAEAFLAKVDKDA